MGPSRQVREGRPGPGTHSPVPRVRAELGHWVPLPALSPGGGRRRPEHPSSGHARSTAPRGPPPPPQGDSRRSRTESGPSYSSSSHPEEKGGAGSSGGLLTGRQDMARPATARPPPPPHEAPSQGRRGAAPGPLECLLGVLLSRRRLSQPQQHGGSGHTERAPDTEPAASGDARARSGLRLWVGKRRRAVAGLGGRGPNRWSRPTKGGALDLRNARGDRKADRETQVEEGKTGGKWANKKSQK